MKLKKLRFLFCALLIIGCVSALCVQCFDFAIPDDISVFSDTDPQSEITAPFVHLRFDESDDGTQGAVSSGTSADADAMLLGVIELKTVSVSVYDKISLCPGGMPFGVKMTTKGVLVIGTGDVDCEGQNKNPCRDAGIRAGDLIVKVNGEEIKDAESLQELTAQSEGRPIELTILRGEETRTFKVAALKSKSDGVYRLGLWIKDRAAGIGTVTFYNEENGTFAGLGHGICDVESGCILPLDEGNVFNVRIDAVTPGKAGDPGELRGYFTSGKTGALYANTNYGVFGIMAKKPEGAGDAVPIALKNEVKQGEAKIRCTLDDEGIGEYSVKISKIDTSNRSDKNFVVEVTDPKLLEITGGIVQGMSGSPIIQDGKLVGAVTHVLVDDPTKGYGIFIENMLDAAG